MIRIICGDALATLRTLDSGIAHTVVTSPPYWGLRDYGVDGQIGLEASPDEFIESLVVVFREVRRVLRDDGTLWLNMGDSYANTNGAGWKPKDLIGMPWRVALALQADGWYLRSDIIWHKPNPMPESATDRPSKSHEYVFLLSKEKQYYYDADTVRIAHSKKSLTHRGGGRGAGKAGNQDALGKVASGNWGNTLKTRKVDPRGCSLRDVWTIPTQPYKGAHFATFPEALARRCILAGCPEGGTVLDPFGGAGTTGLVADKLGRDAILIELNPEYAEMARRRIEQDCPMFSTVQFTPPPAAGRPGEGNT